jgi:GTP pyrophosphokinase
MANAPPLLDVLARWRADRARQRKESKNLSLVLDALSSAKPTDERRIVAVLDVLDDLGVDNETLAAFMAYTANLPRDAFGESKILELVDGQRRAEQVWELHRQRTSTTGLEGLRRLLLAIIGDLRVMFILLAKHLVDLRAASKNGTTQQHVLAELSAEILAPLANRMGVWQVKWELEDLAFRYLQPEAYKRIARKLDEHRGDQERFIEKAKRELSQALKKAGIEAELSGRSKHIFSIWKKMQRKQQAFEDLYDIRALRVIVDDVATCYAALGVVHGLWPNLPREFDDYIARPKGNDYRSLHTACVGPEGKTVEIQIRTKQMHAHAELGVAAHWRYKEGGAADAAFERKIVAMRQILEARSDTDDDVSLMRDEKTKLTDDRIYVLTPQAKVIDLPQGATVLDFAYHVHTEVGHRCRGAKVNGRIVTLNFVPSSGDTVEILTAKESAPRRDWITTNSGFLTSHRAKEKVRAWFRQADHERNVSAGRELFEKELKRVSLAATALDQLPSRFQLKTLEELFVALGIGEITSSQIARALHEMTEPKITKVDNGPVPIRKRKFTSAGVVIQGVGNLMYVLAKCCQPLPGDPVLGWLTRGRGVSIHHQACKSLITLINRDGYRVVQVEWGQRDAQAYEVNIRVRAYDRKGLLKDVSAIISGADIAVLGANTRVDAERGEADLTFTIRVTDYGQLSSMLHKIQALPNVIEAKRIAG